MITAVDQLVAALPYVGDVGSIVRTPKGFLIRTSKGPEHTPYAFEVEIDDIYNVNSDIEVKTELAIGWYQNDEAEMFYYEGEGYWKEVGLVNSKILTGKAFLGELEFIG